jgi:tetratricopeptide (TPR) repeat protein
MSTGSVRKADPQLQSILEQYETAMRFFAQQKFDKARQILEKVRECPYHDVADRATMHWNTCNERLQENGVPLKTDEDHYNFAVLNMNLSHYDEAEEHLQKAIKLGGKKGHFEYALAALHALRHEIDAALVHLQEAVALDPANRLLARTDSDFRQLMEDPRFTEILYPERN